MKSQAAKWTVMVYMAGENGLSDAGDQDLADMRKVGSTPEVNVVVEFDNEGDLGTSRYHVQKFGVEEKVENLGETDSGDPTVLSDFITWSIDTFPAERYALVLWSHGSGWAPLEIKNVAEKIKANQFDVRQANMLSASQLGRTLFNTTLEKVLSLDTPHKRYICRDDGTGHALDTIQLSQVLSEATEKLRQPIDLLGMDACLMSNLEVAHQLEPYVRFMVASETEESNEGWPFDVIIQRFVDRPDMPTSRIAESIVDDYVTAYQKWNRTDVIQSALDLSKVKQISNQMDILAGAMLDHMPKASDEIDTAQKISKNFHNQWDISHFCKELITNTGDNSVMQASQDMRSALEAGPEKFIVAQSHIGSWFDKCCGVSVYLIRPPMQISPYYADLGFAKETRWLRMLQAFHSP